MVDNNIILTYTVVSNQEDVKEGARMPTNIPSDSVIVRNARLAVSRELAKKKALGQPIARFDPKTREIYMENADGTITPMGTTLRRGRYSERSE